MEKLQILRGLLGSPGTKGDIDTDGRQAAKGETVPGQDAIMS